MSNRTEIAHRSAHRFHAGPCMRMRAGTLALAGVAVFAACKQERPLRDVTLGLGWVHQAQFSGPYYADRHGVYAAEGLRVEFVPANASRDPLDEFLAGKYDFVIAQPDALIIARQKGHRVKAVAATYRIHPLVYVALQSSGIEKPQDFRGKTVGVAYGHRLPLVAMLRHLGIDPGEVHMVQSGYGLDGLASGKFDVQGAWLINELIGARKANLKLNVIAPYDYGITFYADVLVARESLIEQEPELVAKLVRATMRGWSEALQDPAASARLALHYDPTLDLEHQHELLKASAPLVHTGMEQVGWMRAEDWEIMIATLHQEGLIPERPAVQDVYTTRFLEESPIGRGVGRGVPKHGHLGTSEHF
jgi:NitT/TauT family transport system substrate-binding protein